MKSEILKFIDANFETIKEKFTRNETQIIEELGESESEVDTKHLLDFLAKQINVKSSLELLEVINDRSLGVDLDNDDEVKELFKMIKNIIK